MSNHNLEKLLRWRCIGPFRGGRVLAVAGDSTNSATFYFGACAGGVWKTVDGGQYWQNVSDGFFNTASIGALAVAPSDPNVIYAGTGESTIRIDVSHGDGMYKSTDAGRSWSHIGLTETRHIGKIAVHPENPDVAYVAALGHAFGNNPERGVYRTQDGGKTWELVLHKSEKAGAVDIKLDPQNPRVIYATIWEAYRNFWQISSGGPDSGLWRSMDGGDTWEEISRNKGLPQEGLLGKMGVAPSPAKSGRVWALLEAEKDPGLYRSDDYGDSWERVNKENKLYDRAWYYIHLTADTQDADTVYVNCLSFYKSVDGGKTFDTINVPHGDCHDLWIDPNNAERMIHGNDGGACTSYNGGASWSSIFNQPTAQFYHISVDNQYPYRVYGTQQDNSSISIPSSCGERGAIPWGAIYEAGTGESGYIVPRPDDPNIVYVGAIGSSPGGGNSLQRYDHRTKQIRLIANWPENNAGYGAIKDRYRFNWTYPIVISPHDPNVLYVGGNQVLKTTDEGQTWTEISPDLTRNDPDKLQATGGPITRYSIGAEVYCTVFSFEESAHEAGLFWAGSDDGLVHISKNGGESWENITPPQLPEWTMISMIELSPHDKATAYIAATKYKLDDYTPYVYKTTDYGQTWTTITDGIREHEACRAIRCDPAREGLLYLGTETGVYVSFDDGENWQAFNLNLPTAPVHDLIVKDNELIAGTHGRSIWILDDITPLHQLKDELDSVHLFRPKDTVRIMPPLWSGFGAPSPGKKSYNTMFTEITTFYEDKDENNAPTRRYLDAGEDRPQGVLIGYYLAEDASDLKLEILDQDGNVIRTITPKPAEREEMREDEKAELKSRVYAPIKAGMNRFLWDMRHEDGAKIKGKEPAATVAVGPYAIPGEYKVRLTVGDVSQTQPFTLLADPRVTTSAEDMTAQLDLLLQIRDKIGEGNEVVNTIRDIDAQVDGWLKRVPDEKVQEAGKALKEQLKAIESPLIPRGNTGGWEIMRAKSRLLTQLANLRSYVACADFKPTAAAHEHYDFLVKQMDEQLAAYDTALGAEVASFNQLVAKAGAPAVVIG